MTDRVAKYPGRVKLVPVANLDNTYDMTMADGATTAGTPLNKSTFLKTSTASTLGLTGADPTPDDAFLKLFQCAGDGKTAIATAITGKGVPTNPSDTFAQMATNISNISTADATPPTLSVSANGLITAKSSGGTATKQLPTISGQTITPGTASKTLPAQRYTTGAVVISGDTNLAAENIISGKSIFGVSGVAKFPKCASIGLLNETTFTLVSSSGTTDTWEISLMLPDVINNVYGYTLYFEARDDARTWWYFDIIPDTPIVDGVMQPVQDLASGELPIVDYYSNNGVAASGDVDSYMLLGTRFKIFVDINNAYFNASSGTTARRWRGFILYD